MSTKQVYRNIDYTESSAYLTIKEYEKVLGIKFDPDNKFQRNSPANRDSTVPQFPFQEHKQLARLSIWILGPSLRLNQLRQLYLT
jgi:hypothetical protein